MKNLGPTIDNLCTLRPLPPTWMRNVRNPDGLKCISPRRQCRKAKQSLDMPAIASAMRIIATDPGEPRYINGVPNPAWETASRGQTRTEKKRIRRARRRA